MLRELRFHLLELIHSRSIFSALTFPTSLWRPLKMRQRSCQLPWLQSTTPPCLQPSGATAAPTTTAPVTTTPSPVVVKSDLKVAFPPAAKTALMAAGNEQKLAAVTKAVGSVNFKTYCEGLVVTRAFESVAECKQAFTTSGNGNPVEVTMTEQVFGGDAAAKPHTDLDLTGFSRRRLASHNSDKIVNEFTLTVKAPDAKAVASFKAQTETLQAALTTKLNNATETAARFSSIKTIAEAAPGGTALFSAAGLLANVTVASLTTEAVSAPPTGGDLPPAAVSSAATVAMSAAASLIMGALFLF
ncbi:unnamed protein product [Amoebophrya sp. A25]|nr:unnamed protein product [Amoebophrya sp. A25]|eukprot:GSA25T00023053001.1